MVLGLILIAGPVNAQPTAITTDALYKTLLNNYASLTYGVAEYEFCTPESDVNSNLLDYDFIPDKDSPEIDYIDQFIWTENIPYQETVNDYVKEQCLSDLKNETPRYYECGYYVPRNVTLYRDGWLKLDGVLPKDRCHKIRLVAHWSPKLGHIGIEWIPKVRLNNVEYRKTEWAYWSASYAYKLLINCTGMTDNTPFIINGSSGFMIDGIQQYVWTYCKGNGTAVYYTSKDVYVVANDTNQLPFEVETGNGTSYLPRSVWDANYLVVQHFNEAFGTILDSTTYGNNGTTGAGISYRSTGQMGYGLEFDGVTGNVTFGGITVAQSHLTVEAWINGDNFPDATHDMIITKGTMGSDGDYYLSIASDKLWWAVRPHGVSREDIAGSTSLSDDTWYRIVGTKDASFSQVFLNGDADIAPNALNGNIGNANPIWLGNIVSGGLPFDGTLDEFRISNTRRSNAHLNETYKNAIGTTGYGTLDSPLEEAPITYIISVNIAFVSPTPTDNETVGFDYNFTPTFSVTTENCSIDILTLEIDGVNTTQKATDLSFDPDIETSVVYLYKGWINCTGNDTETYDNYTVFRRLVVSTFTVDELATRFTLNDLMILLLFVLVGILVYAIIKS